MPGMKSVKPRAFSYGVAAAGHPSLSEGGFLAPTQWNRGAAFQQLLKHLIVTYPSFYVILVSFLFCTFYFTLSFLLLGTSTFFLFNSWVILWEALHKRDMDFFAPKSSVRIRMIKIHVFLILQKPPTSLTPWHCDVLQGKITFKEWWLMLSVCGSVCVLIQKSVPLLCVLSLPKLYHCSTGGYHGGGRVLERSRSHEGDQASELGAIIR